jgi:hypothetical protein
MITNLESSDSDGFKKEGKYSKCAEVVKTSNDLKAGFKSGYDDDHEIGKAIKHLKTIESHSKK